MGSAELGYEQILEEAGGFGRYQILSYIWCSLSNLINAGPMAFMIFGGIFPRKASNCSTDFLNSSISIFDDSKQIGCKQDVYTFPSIIQEWGLTGNLKYIFAAIVALEMCGTLIGSLFLGNMADRFGRKPVLLMAFLCQGIAGIGCALAQSWQLFAAMFFFYGLSFGVIAATRLILFFEVIVQRWRLLSYFPGPPVGFLLLAVIAGWVAKDWRELMLWCQAPIPLIIVMTLYPLLESPKWLLDRGKTIKFKKTIEKICKWNRKQFKLDPSVIESTLQSGKLTNSGKHYSILDLFQRRWLSLKILSLAFAWTTADLTQYTIFLNLGNATGNIFLNIIVIMNFRMLLISVVIVVERNLKMLGRKLILQLCQITICISMALACIYFLISSNIDINPTLLQIPLGLAVGCMGTVWPALEIITTETIPTEIRTMGQGFCSAAGCAGSMIAPYISLIYFVWQPGPYVLVGIINLISCVLITLILNETKGKELPSLADIASKQKCSSGIELETLFSQTA